MRTRRLLVFAAGSLAACNSVDLRGADPTGGGGSTAVATTTHSSSATTAAGGTGGDAGATPCGDSEWTAASEESSPVNRDYGMVDWTGQLCIWSGTQIDIGAEGLVADGACYDRLAASWRTMTAVGSPSARVLPASAWTGTEVLVWGGKNYYTYCQFQCNPGNGSGARYNPTTNTWSTMTLSAAPFPRSGHIAVWTGSLMLVSRMRCPAPLAIAWQALVIKLMNT